MQVIPMELGPFAARCVVLADRASGRAMVVDPGFEAHEVVARVRREALEVTTIVLTHGHIDHACGVAVVREAFPAAPVLIHPADIPLLQSLPEQAALFGLDAMEPIREDGRLSDGQELPLGGLSLLVRHCPGHSPGHVVLIHRDESIPVAVVGDVLFAGSVGRTDLWGGSFPQLENSIREVLYRLPGHTRVVPGHGPDTTIAEEMAGNPFVSGG